MKKIKWYAIVAASKAVMGDNIHPPQGCFVWPEEIPVTDFDSGNSSSDTLPCDVVPRARSYTIQDI
jgi:hypothetical protein